MDKEFSQIKKQKTNAAMLSLFANLFLILIKLAVSVFSGSIGLAAEAIHSSFDFIASIFAFIGVEKSSKPADNDHHYGHYKYEYLSSLAQSTLLILTGIFVIYESLNRIITPHIISHHYLAIIVIVISLVVDYLIYRRLLSTAQETQSPALMADAQHFSTDIISTIAVAIGLVFSKIGYSIFDPISAMVVAAIMIHTGYNLANNALYTLTDKSPTENIIEEMQRIIENTKGVKNQHKFRARLVGNQIFAEVHVRVQPKISVESGHQIAHNVKTNLSSRFENLKEITIHIEPYKKSSHTK